MSRFGATTKWEVGFASPGRTFNRLTPNSCANVCIVRTVVTNGKPARNASCATAFGSPAGAVPLEGDRDVGAAAPRALGTGVGTTGRGTRDGDARRQHERIVQESAPVRKRHFGAVVTDVGAVGHGFGHDLAGFRGSEGGWLRARFAGAEPHDDRLRTRIDLHDLVAESERPEHVVGRARHDLALVVVGFCALLRSVATSGLPMTPLRFSHHRYPYAAFNSCDECPVASFTQARRHDLLVAPPAVVQHEHAEARHVATRRLHAFEHLRVAGAVGRHPRVGHAQRPEQPLLRERDGVLPVCALDDRLQRLDRGVVVRPHLTGRLRLRQRDGERGAIHGREELHVVDRRAPLAARIVAQEIAHA